MKVGKYYLIKHISSTYIILTCVEKITDYEIQEKDFYISSKENNQTGITSKYNQSKKHFNDHEEVFSLTKSEVEKYKNMFALTQI